MFLSTTKSLGEGRDRQEWGEAKKGVKLFGLWLGCAAARGWRPGSRSLTTGDHGAHFMNAGWKYFSHSGIQKSTPLLLDIIALTQSARLVSDRVVSHRLFRDTGTYLICTLTSMAVSHHRSGLSHRDELGFG